jgi:DNA-directed RNA polymerase specialized sigma24 family protein
VAVRLEQLVERDQVPFEQALRQLRINEGVALAEEDLRELATGLPRRPARREEDASLLDGLAVSAEVVEGALLAEEREARRRKLRDCLENHLAQLADEDALLLRLRFGQGRSVVAIAQSFGRPAKPLYRRIEALLRRLREGLEAAGFGARDSAELIEASAWDDGREVLP